MAINPYKQTLTHSCLAACFLMLLNNGQKCTESDEQAIALQGSKRIYPFYVVGIPIEVTKRFGRQIIVYVDNSSFANTLHKAFLDDKKIQVVHQQITSVLITKLLADKPLICHIDTHALGDYSHTSHFIVLEKATKQFISIIDPWSGERRRVSQKTLGKAIGDLKTQVKMCPLLFSVDA